MDISQAGQQFSSLNLSYLLSLITFVFSVSITPGPNNLMVTASGIRFGFSRTIPHILGICVGFISICILVALGLGSLFLSFPILQTTLKLVGSAYLLYLAYKIIRSASPDTMSTAGKPLAFLHATVFQLVNPKGWTMAITGVSAFSLSGDYLVSSTIAVILSFTVVTPICVCLWTLLGTKISELITQAKYLRWFNYTLGLLTASCVFIILA